MCAGRHNHFADCHQSQAVTPGSDPSVYFLWHEEKDDEGIIDLCREPPALYSMTRFTCSREHALFHTLNLPRYAIFLRNYWFISSDWPQTGAFDIDHIKCVREVSATFICFQVFRQRETRSYVTPTWWHYFVEVNKYQFKGIADLKMTQVVLNLYTFLCLVVHNSGVISVAPLTRKLYNIC